MPLCDASLQQVFPMDTSEIATNNSTLTKDLFEGCEWDLETSLDDVVKRPLYKKLQKCNKPLKTVNLYRKKCTKVTTSNETASDLKDEYDIQLHVPLTFYPQDSEGSYILDEPAKKRNKVVVRGFYGGFPDPVTGSTRYLKSGNMQKWLWRNYCSTHSTEYNRDSVSGLARFYINKFQYDQESLELLENKKPFQSLLISISHSRTINELHVHVYDIMLAKSYIRICNKQSSRKSKLSDIGSGRYKPLQGIQAYFDYDRFENSPLSSLPPNALALPGSASRVSNRIKDKVPFSNKYADDDNFLFFTKTSKQKALSDPAEKLKFSYKRSEWIDFYHEEHDEDNETLYHCVYHQQKLYQQRKKKNPEPLSRNTCISTLFDFETFRLTDPQPDETLLEENESRCCYCGLEWASFKSKQRIQHIRLHKFEISYKGNS